MDEQMRREIQRKKQAEKKQKQKRNVTVGILVLIAILCGVLVFFLVRGKTDDAKENQSTESGQGTGTEAAPEKTVTLSEEQKHTGNLILVSADYKYYFDENAADLKLVNIHDYQGWNIPVASEELQLAERIMEPLHNMITDCDKALGVNNTGVTSAYRSLDYQQKVYDQYKEENGEEYAKAYVATPGYSEHHTGLALDMGLYDPDGTVGSFSGSDQAEWIDKNCYRYGFVRRYKEEKADITKINNESWHFRYVGIPHAFYMEENDLCLEEYISYLRDHTSQDQPLAVQTEDGTSYEIYSVKDGTIEEPKGTYTVDGDNIDGYIITIQK